MRSVQGQLWRGRAQDWATYVEPVCLPLFEVELDAARVTEGTRLLGASYGAGLLALLASFRNAQVAALDATAGLLAIARQRLPGVDVQEGDLKKFSFAEAGFDAVVAVKRVFYVAGCASWRRVRSPVPSSSRAPKHRGAETRRQRSTTRPLLTAARPRFAPCMQMPTASTCAPMGVFGTIMSFSGLLANNP
jgi:SAM-dependent methyltransferase